jgi:hypothetical protein
MTAVLRVRQADVEWLRSLGIPGTDAALDSLKKEGEVVVVDDPRGRE